MVGVVGSNPIAPTNILIIRFPFLLPCGNQSFSRTLSMVLPVFSQINSEARVWVPVTLG